MRLTALALCLCLLAGCAEQFDATSLGVPVTMEAPIGQVVEGSAFSVRKTSLHALWGLFHISQPALDEALAGQLVGGRAVANLRIKVSSRWSDLLITGLTLGLIVPRSVTFEGVITGAPPQQPPPDAP